MADPPLTERIAEDPILRDIKMIAEAWDAAGAYQVGTFSRGRWAEWNGRFRDDVRRYWRGDDGMRGALASRLAGSADLYADSGRGPGASINYVTAHDGFTLRDLVSYNRKHNERNGENNRDGTDANYSCNHGVEGPTLDPEILAVRRRQMKNLLLTLAVARGVPMILAGDEFGRTQEGNNNAYCQDNRISWVDWGLRRANDDLVRFTRELLALRRAHPSLHRDRYYADDEVRWFGADGARPQWDDPAGRVLGVAIDGRGADDLALLFNAGTEPAAVRLPGAPGGGRWMRRADTALDSPDDIRPAGRAVPLEAPDRYALAPRSSAILSAPPAAPEKR
jgi:glycogen operon protein